jgi:hypothetical protein
MKMFLKLIKEVVSDGMIGNIKTYEGLDSTFEMRKMASEESINKCSSSFKFPFPDEYKQFLGKYNGGILFKVQDIAGFDVFGTNEIEKENSFQKENFGTDWNDSIILFCCCVGDAEYIGFKFDDEGKYSLVYCIMDELPENWHTFKGSFGDFVETLINENGRKYWGDMIWPE